MGRLLKVLRWIVMVVGVIEIVGGVGSLASGNSTNSTVYPLIFWVVLVVVAGYFEFQSNKKKLISSKNESAAKEVSKEQD